MMGDQILEILNLERVLSWLICTLMNFQFFVYIIFLILHLVMKILTLKFFKSKLYYYYIVTYTCLILLDVVVAHNCEEDDVW